MSSGTGPGLVPTNFANTDPSSDPGDTSGTGRGSDLDNAPDTALGMCPGAVHVISFTRISWYRQRVMLPLALCQAQPRRFFKHGTGSVPGNSLTQVTGVTSM